MKYRYIVLFLICQIAWAQNSPVEQAEEFHANENYSEEIKLRKSIMDTITDKNSDFYKTQSFKKLFAEFYFFEDLDVKHEKISQAETILNSISNPDPFDKIEVGYMFYMLLGGMQHPDGIQKIEDAYEVAKALPQSEKRDKWLAEIYNGLGNVYLYYQKLDKAVHYFEKEADLNTKLYGYNSTQTARSLDMLSITHSYTNNYPLVLEYADKTLEIYETIKPEDPFILFRQYAGNLQVNKYYGDEKRVKKLYEKIQKYYDTHKNDANFLQATHREYYSLNPVYTTYYYAQIEYANVVGDSDLAESALAKFKRTLPKGKTQYTGFERNKILSYLLETGSGFHRSSDKSNLDNFKKAKKYYTEATEFAKKENFDFGEIQSYMILSTLGVDYRQWKEVIDVATKALSHHNIDVFNQIQTLKHNLGMAYANLGDFEKAFETFEDEYEFYLHDSGVDYYSITNLTESGNIYLEIYEKSHDEKYLENAYNHFLLASQIFSKLYRGGEFSSHLHLNIGKINEGLLASSIRLNKYKKEVISQIEINNSDYLWSSFLRNRKIPFDEALVNLQKIMDSLQNRQMVLAKQIERNTLNDDKLSALRSELKDTENKFQTINSELQELDNSYYQFSRTDFKVEDIQKSIGSHQQVIRYVLTESSSFVYLIDQGSVELIRLEKSADELKELVVPFLEDLKEINSDFISRSNTIYANLIQPLPLREDADLIIIPDGFLAYLPFEVLMNDASELLLTQHAISYGYSLKLLRLQNVLKEDFKNRLAAFSPEYNLEVAMNSGDEDIQILVRSGNYKLEGAANESKEITSLFNGALFMGSKATKSNFIDNSLNYDIFHLAMHAIVDEEDPAKSSLLFGDEERLFLDEMYDLKIPAHLAVLSACNTGFGEIRAGEGVQSFSRAFTYAGVKSTVMSLWPVPDQQTNVIMTEFYRQLKAGKSKAEALRQAKLNYLNQVEEPELKHPYYWAGFLISGDVEPLKTSKNSRWYVIGGVFMLFILLTAMSRRRKNAASQKR